MKIAVVAGGWHFPLHFFQRIAAQASGIDLFVVAHRNPELAIVREEKKAALANVAGSLADLDRQLYSEFPTVPGLMRLGWTYEEAPNTVGDWGFFNQWLERHDYREYDVILNCHDDTYIRRMDLFEQLAGDWMILANGRYATAPEGWVRGSFEFWKREMLEKLGGRFDLGHVGLTREGLTDSPAGLAALSTWNNTGLETQRFLNRNGLSSRIASLSEHYRVSAYAIEGERGFMHSNEGAPWAFESGLKAHPIGAAA